MKNNYEMSQPQDSEPETHHHNTDSPLNLNQILLDHMPCVALLLKTKTREIVASNKAARDVGAVPGAYCYSTWGQRDTPCPWCLAPNLWNGEGEQHLIIEAIGVIWDAYWVPVTDDIYMHYAFDITEKVAIENALRKSETEKKAILDALPDTVSLKDNEFRFVWANKTLLDIMGSSLEEIEGKVCYEISHDRDKPCEYCNVENALKTNKIQRTTVKFIDGSTRDAITIPIKYPNNETYTIEISRDITQQSEYNKKLEALHALADGLSNQTNVDEIADLVVETASGVLGFKRVAFGVVEDRFMVLAAKPALTITGGDLNGPGITIRAARTGKPQLVQDVRQDPDYVAVEAESEAETRSEYAIPIIVGGKPAAVLNVESSQPYAFKDNDLKLIDIFVDHITASMERLAYKKREEALFSKLVEEQVKAEQALEMDRLKSNLMNTATHEIRTPLTSIMGYSEIIRDKINETKNEDLLQYFDVLERNITRLDRLSGDLLDLQRIELGRMNLNKSRVAIGRVIQQVQAEMNPIITERNQTLETTIQDPDREVEMDELRIIQVLINLITNASKFSPPSSTVKLVVIDEGEETVFSVSDQGVGLSKADISKLFEPFPDIHLPDVPHGTGLGLSICKGMVNLHRGRIWATSDGEKKGSTFTFTIPN